MLRAIEMNKIPLPNNEDMRMIPGAKSHVFTILLSSRDRCQLDTLVSVVSEIREVDIRTNHICNGHCDPLHEADSMPDLLIFQTSDHWQEELEALIRRPTNMRPALIIIGDTRDEHAMRMAMKAGANDYIKSGFVASELHAAIQDLIRHQGVEASNSEAPIFSVINAKGGSGGSLIACNLAHILSATSNKKVALVDLDLQFGSLCHYLDMKPKYGLVEALNNVYDLDETALDGFMLKHPSSLHLLDVKPGDLLIPEDIRLENMHILLDLMAKSYDQIIIDLPRHIGLLSSMVLEKSTKVIVVLQQSISHIRDTKRLLHILQHDIGISEEKIRIVLNRYTKKSDLTLADIQKAIGRDVEATIPNAFQQVSQSINEGLPLYELSKKSAITQALGDLGDSLTQTSSATHRPAGLIRRVIQSLRAE